MSKQQQTYRYGGCNSKHSSLYRGFGSWPTYEFKQTPEDAQVQFYNDLKSKKEGAVIAYAAEVLKSYEEKQETYASNGEFRPVY